MLITISLVMLALAALLTVFRMVQGPTLLDRIVCLDVLAVFVVLIIGVGVALRRDPDEIIIMLVVALIGFMGSVSVARLVERREG